MANENTYLKATMSNSETIIDTASLLQPGFEPFIRKNAETLLASGFKIIISRDVRMELIKLISSSNPVKAALAFHASTVIADYKDIFCVEPGHVSDEDIYKAFADRAILSRLTSNSGEISQLLITNDKNLARDAFNINHLDSCRSHKVKVCYLNDDGNLCRCSCTIPSSADEPSPVPEESSSADMREDTVGTAGDDEPSNGTSMISSIIIGSSFFSLGVVVGKFLL